jgi:uncharacterized protein (DUF2062 family)
MPSRTQVRQRWTQALLHTHDTPRRTAAALALGVLVGFSPFLGLHVVMGTALAFILNLNRVAVLIGVISNVPWIIGPYYVAATALGAWMTGRSLPPDVLHQVRTLTDLPGWSQRATALGELVEPLVLPFTVGSTVCAVLLGVGVFLVARPILEARAAFARSNPPGKMGSGSTKN